MDDNFDALLLPAKFQLLEWSSGKTQVANFRINSKNLYKSVFKKNLQYVKKKSSDELLFVME